MCPGEALRARYLRYAGLLALLVAMPVAITLSGCSDPVAYDAEIRRGFEEEAPRQVPVYFQDVRTGKCFIVFQGRYFQPMETECTPEVMEVLR
jgi:hypothetical protein